MVKAKIEIENKAEIMALWRRLANLNPKYILPSFFHGGATNLNFRALNQLTLEYSFSTSSGNNGGKRGGKEEGDLFKRGFDNARSQTRPSAADKWDFSAKDDEDNVFEVSPAEGDDNGVWKFDEGKDGEWKGFEDGGEGLGQENQGFDNWGLEGGVEKGGKDEEEGGDGVLVEGVKGEGGGHWEDSVKTAQQTQLENEKIQLTAQLEGSNRAFGDLIAATGITDVQIESLILMQDLEKVDGLPPLKELEDARRSKLEKKSTRGELEQQRQQEIAKARVRKVDENGRAYGTGRRKCSVARVWIQPGNGKFIVNGKSFDVYFPQLAQRTDLLSPFVFTKTLGLWDVVSSVNGGGVSGQVGAVRHGISRALQNWEPGLRPYLRTAGLLTRDPRMVERKKPGKAKARKSFQWVKR